MENHLKSEIIGNPNAPFMNQEAVEAGQSLNYFGVGHPSLVNYLELTGGSNFGITNDDPLNWVKSVVLAICVHAGAARADAEQADFYIAERRPGAALVPYQMNGLPTITVPADSVEEWTVENWTNEVHAFHIHQVHFRVLAVNGQTVADTPLLDTVTVPAAAPADITGAAQVVPGQVRIKLFFPESLAGDIPFHCHLVDHEDNGMMGVLRVTPRAGADVATETTAHAHTMQNMHGAR